MRTTFKILIVLILSGFIKSVDAQSGKSNILYLDLAGLNPEETKTITENHTYDTVILKNCIIGKKYSIKVSRKMIELPPLSFNISGLTAAEEDVNPSCSTLLSQYNALKKLFVNANPNFKLVDEKQVSKAVMDLGNELKKSVCDNSNLRNSSDSLINLCHKVIPQNIEVHSGEAVSIVVTRDEKVWTWELVGDNIGEWVMSFGFGFCSSSLEATKYHLEPVNDTSTFKITKDSKPGVLDLSYIPAIFYSFLPATKYNSNYNWSLTAGLGFDLSAPVVFVGGGFMFHQNIGVSMGMAFQQQSKLLPQYTEGQILNSSLEKDQLHERIYRPNLFIAINFRFDKNKNSEIQAAIKPK